VTTSTRYLGYCPCCNATFKVRDEKLVHHGYKRPGYGFIVGDCMGALETPHELSPELATRYRDALTNALTGKEDRLASLMKATEITDPHGQYDPKTRKYEPTQLRKGECSEYKWEQVWGAAKRSLERQIASYRDEIARVTKLVETWEAKPLTSVEEEKAAKQTAKVEREKAARAKKNERLRVAVEKFQKRIDSAVRNRNSSTLADIWASAQTKLRDIDGSLDKATCVAMLERDEVWAAFGLAGMVKSHWKTAPNERPEEEPLRRMKDRMDRVKKHYQNWYGNLDDWMIRQLKGMSLVWPESLGGENKQGQKTLDEINQMLANRS